MTPTQAATIAAEANVRQLCITHLDQQLSWSRGRNAI